MESMAVIPVNLKIGHESTVLSRDNKGGNRAKTGHWICQEIHLKGVVEKMSFCRSKRSIKTRKFYTTGNRADGKWVDSVEEASTTVMSIGRVNAKAR
jgi:hypothetical protein